MEKKEGRNYKLNFLGLAGLVRPEIPGRAPRTRLQIVGTGLFTRWMTFLMLSKNLDHRRRHIL